MIAFLPTIIPLFTAAVLLALWTKPQLKKYVSLTGSIAHLTASFFLLYQVIQIGEISVQLGNWQRPFGIVFEADILSGLLVMITGLIGFSVNIYAFEDLDRPRRDFGYHPLFFVLLAGVTGAFSTGDLFNLFVWFECILLSSFVLLALGGEKKQIRGSVNYVLPNLFSSMIFLTGLGFIYGVCGTLNMADLGTVTPQVPIPTMTAIALLFLISFSVKAAVFPFITWLPTSYHTPPITISALFAGLLTKVGVYALFRFFTKVYPLSPGIIADIILYASCLTMVVGILGAISQKTIKKILAWNLVSHIGFMTLGLAFRDALSISSGIFYMIHHILVITTLYFLTGIIEQYRKTTSLSKLGNLVRTRALLSVLLFIPMLALVGIPPFSGFWPKLGLFIVAVNQQQWILLGAMIITSFLTLYSMVKIWQESAWKPEPDSQLQDHRPKEKVRLKYGAVALLLATTIVISIAPSYLFGLTTKSADQLANTWKRTTIGGDN